MLETKAETQLHKSIVRALIEYFTGQRWTVTAAASSDFPEPETVGRHEPDVVAKDGGQIIVYGEAKTGEGDIGTQHSREQYRDFSSRMMTDSGVSCPFYICVPRNQETHLRGVFAEEGLGSKSNVTVLVYG